MDDMHAIRLLHLAPRFYGCPITGVELRNYHLGARLAKHMRVTHVGFSRPEESPLTDTDNPRHRLISVPRPASYRLMDLLRGAVGPLPFSVLNYTRGEMADALARLLQEEWFDIVLLEGEQLGGYLPLLRRAMNRPSAIICDWHNIESEVLHRYADAAVNRGAEDGAAVVVGMIADEFDAAGGVRDDLRRAAEYFLELGD